MIDWLNFGCILLSLQRLQNLKVEVKERGISIGQKTEEIKMEVKGFIVKIESDYIRVETFKEKQEIDIFFDSDYLKEHVRTLIVGRLYKGMVRTQSVDVNGQKLAKLWMWFGDME